MEEPYVGVSQFFSALYFSYFGLVSLLRLGWDRVLD